LFLFDGFVQDTESSVVICAQRRWGLFVAQLGGCDSERDITLGVVKARSNFLYHVFDDCGDVESGSVECFLLGGFVPQEKQTSETAPCVGDREV
jgi:hypothetical protein